MESKGIEPVRPRLESSISLTEPFELHVIPVKLHIELLGFDSQESNKFVLDFWRAVLRFRSIWSSLELAKEKRERMKSGYRRWRFCRKVLAADISEG